MKIAVITSGFLPVPATKGGAVENLIVNLLNENENEKKIEFNIFSTYDKAAILEAEKYSYTKFIFFKPSFLIKGIDKAIFWTAKNILKKKNSHSYRYICQRIDYLNKVSKILKKNNFDKVLLENHPTQYLALKWRKNYIKYFGRYYYHCHNEFSDLCMCDNIMKKTNKIICVSNFIANVTQKQFNCEKEKFVILKNCIDYTKFTKKYDKSEISRVKEKYGISDKDKILLFTGRIVPEKGVLEIVKALELIKHKNYKLLILGAPLNNLNTKTNYQKNIEKLVEKKNNVVFTGFVNYDDIPLYYSIADIALLPSICNDAAPLSVIESLVCGVPIITTNSGGIPEYATNGSAIIIERDDNIVERLAQSIEFLLNNEKELKKMSLVAKQVSKDLQISKYYENFIEIIEK